MKPIAKALCLCLSVLLLLLSFAACRNRNFNPAVPPSDGENGGGDGLSAELGCWVRLSDGTEYPLAGDRASAIYTAVKKAYESSDTVEPFPDRGDGLRLIFCMGGIAPESSIPAYQLPNATLYGVYTIFPDDTGWYGDDLITAHVHTFRLKAGTYASLLEMAGRES
jgi:hypothetical protein